MAIDLPPVMPPVLTDATQVETRMAASPTAINAQAGNTDIRVYGNRYLSESDVVDIISGSTTPSEAIIQLTRRYYEDGHLLVKVRYFKSLDAVLVFVDQLSISEIRGDRRATDHFAHLIGDADLSIEEFDRPRVLADLQAKRGGFDYKISYDELDSNNVALIFEQNKIDDNDATDFIVEANNKGSRFLGRYFGLAAIKHRTEDGTELSAAYQTAFPDFGESRDGEELNQYSFSIDHPFTTGLYGLEISKTDYRRDPRVATGGGNQVLCALDALTSQLGLPLCPDNTGSGRIDIDAEILQFAVRGEQVLYSTPWHRITLNQKIQHIDSTVDQDADSISPALSGRIMDEVYQTAEIGAKYIRTTYSTEDTTPSRLTLGLSLRAGHGDGGTLDDPANANFEVDTRKRTAEFVALLPTLSYQLRIGEKSALSVTGKGQFADEQVPQQQQFVLGGMNGLSAYLPGALVGDAGYFVNAALEHSISLGDFNLTPRVFAEYGGSWFENADGADGDEQSIADAGIGLKLEYGSQLYTELVAATPVSDDVSDDDRLEALEADFYWRLRLTF